MNLENQKIKITIQPIFKSTTSKITDKKKAG